MAKNSGYNDHITSLEGNIIFQFFAFHDTVIMEIKNADFPPFMAEDFDFVPFGKSIAAACLGQGLQGFQRPHARLAERLHPQAPQLHHVRAATQQFAQVADQAAEVAEDLEAVEELAQGVAGAGGLLVIRTDAGGFFAGEKRWNLRRATASPSRPLRAKSSN